METHGYACGCASCSGPDVHPAILSSYTWPDGKQTIQYSFNTHNWTGDVDRNERLSHRLADWKQELVRDAMEAWEEVCNVRFEEVADGPDVDLRIGGGAQVWISEIGAYSAGYYRTTEIDASRNREEGVVVFQVGWSGRDLDTRFYDLALHEIGHALGLLHSDLEGTVMSGPPYSTYADPNPGRDRLTPDDVAGARELFPEGVAPEGVVQTGTPGPDTFNGTEGDDFGSGLGGDDLVYGAGGDDTLVGGPGNDTGYGGSGHDVLRGGTGDDFLAGEAGDDFLIGDAGDDTLFGGDGRDVLKGGSGNDVIEGAAGGDFVLAGSGNDVVRAGSGSDWVEGGDGADTLYGGDGNPDVLAGQRGNDRLVGEAGNDRLWGGGGNDTLLGGEGGDSALAGGEGNDSIDGGAGDDRLLGGAGGDTLIGGSGDDVFRFNSWEGGGRDVIRDYGNGADVIELNLPKGNDGGGLSFRAEAGGTLILGGNVEVLVQGPDAVGLTLSDVEIV